MYGVPKYREPFWWKHKRELCAAVAAAVVITTITRFSPGYPAQSSQMTAGNQVVLKQVEKAYKVEFNGKEVGLVEDWETADEAAEKAYTALKKKLGYDPELDTAVTLKEVKNAKISSDNYYDLMAKLEIAFSSKIEDTKQKAYVVKIGNAFTVAVADEESAKEVLRRAQEKFLDTNMVVDVDLTADQHNRLVTTPKLLVFDPEKKERSLVTSGDPTAADVKRSPLETLNGIVAAVKDKLSGESAAAGAQEAGGVIDISEAQVAQAAPANNEKLLEVSLPKDVLIAESYVAPNKIVDVETATNLVTQNRIEQKVYYVEKGDSPSVIAEKHNMGLSKLYQLNPQLQNGTAVIHVGDEIVITAPEPLLKVIAKYETTYNEPILKTVVEEKDPTMYVGSSKIKEEGQDGLQNVKALITKVNGQQVASQVLDTEVLTEMQPKIRLVGTMPLPPKATTGKFIYPLKRFIFSSGYGYRWGSFHGGIDLAAPRGTEIVASDGGTVIQAGWNNGGYGYMVKIQHSNGTQTLYGHMSKVTCSVGQKVAQGEKIGEVGSTGYSTGNHCHFEIYINGTRVNPTKYL